ncbi:hypothetical protein LIER_07097 [Lithospermum erythrorhizon]|uniref:Uncharacterized protein n=1 Tax=Lithospermum erythrorhizon TaxID=34254 RepID=A0AAV3P719_LITER
MHAALEAHWEAVKRILRYLQSTKTYGLHIRPMPSLTLSAFMILIGLVVLLIVVLRVDILSISALISFLGNLANKAQLVGLPLRLSIRLLLIVLLNSFGFYRYCLRLFFHWLTLLCYGVIILALLIWLPTRCTMLVPNIEIDYHFIREKVAAKTIRVQFVSSKN